MAIRKIFLLTPKRVPISRTSFNNYSTIINAMRKINKSPTPKPQQPQPKKPERAQRTHYNARPTSQQTQPASRITFALNANLCQEAEQMLNSLWSQNDYTYSSLSELIRSSLQAYQNGEFVINPSERDKFTPKREITIRFAAQPQLL